MTPACHICGEQLVPWRHLDRVDVGKGPVSRWRIYESGHAAKTAERTNRERQGTLL